MAVCVAATMAALHPACAAHPSSPAMVRVAAANSAEADKAAADFVCTGKNDEAVFNKAIETLVRGGKFFSRRATFAAEFMV